MPKRPANPFFRFCQEQRPIVLDQIISSGEGEPTKQDLTKRLAVTWNTMEPNNKKVYIKKLYFYDYSTMFFHMSLFLVLKTLFKLYLTSLQRGYFIQIVPTAWGFYVMY